MFLKKDAFLWQSLSFCCVSIYLLPAFAEPVHHRSAFVQEDKSKNDQWVPISINEQRIATAWIQLSSIETLNENSVRVNAKYTHKEHGQITGRLDINCKNKDYYFRPNGILFTGPNWASIEKGSGMEGAAQLLCKSTAAKGQWGYTEETRYLWDLRPPTGDPSSATGEWLLARNDDEAESYWNNSIIRTADVAIVAVFERSKKGDRSAAAPSDTAQYFWVATSCRENLGSFYVVLDKASIGYWGPPVPGRPGGIGMKVRAMHCKP